MRSILDGPFTINTKTDDGSVSILSPHPSAPTATTGYIVAKVCYAYEHHDEIKKGLKVPTSETIDLAKLLAAAPRLLKAVRAANGLFADDHAMSKFDWKNSFLRAQDIRELNETGLLLQKLSAEFPEGK